jgi:hypothetical protein
MAGGPPLAFTLLSACRWSAPEAQPELGWLDVVADHPEQVEDLFRRTGDAPWIAWHSHRYADAWQQLQGSAPEAAARAALDASLLYTDLDRLTAEATLTLVQEWPDLPADSGAWATAWLADRRPEDPYRARLRPEDQALLGEAPAGPDRLALWREAAGGQRTDELLAALAQPWLEEKAGDVTHRWWDPVGYAALAAAWSQRAAPFVDAPPEPAPGALERALFAPWLDAADLAVARQRQTPPTPCESAWHRCLRAPSAGEALTADNPAPTRLGPDLWTRAGMTDGEAARGAGRRVREALTAWSGTLEGRPGGAVVRDLGLADRLRQRWAVDTARALLLDRRCEAAQALLEPAMDVTSRGPGPANAPSLFTTLAHARLQCGRTREALDVLQPLLQVHPEVRTAYEVVADLAVLRGIHRLGDSRED